MNSRNMQTTAASTSLGWNVIVAIVVAIIVLSAPSNQQQSDSGGNIPNYYEAARKMLRDGDNFVKSVPYFQASIPMRIYECIREFSIMRCTKLFVLQKMEERQHYPDSGNLTKDFLDQFFGEEEQMSSLISERYTNMSENELHQRLVVNFQRFFKNRNIKLHFLPGIMVKIVPSKENKLKFMLKKKTKPQRDQISGRSTKTDNSDEDEEEENIRSDGKDANKEANTKQGGGIGGIIGGVKNRRKNKKQTAYKNAILQMAVPVMVMPAILMGTFLPFILPMLKMATFMTMMMNNSAFIAALIYAARTHANAQDEQQHINYGHQAYH